MSRNSLDSIPHQIVIKHLWAAARSMPLWQSYRALTPSTRILIGVGVMAYAGFGLLVSDKAEQAFGYTPTEEDKERLRGAMPKVYSVEKGDGGK